MACCVWRIDPEIYRKPIPVDFEVSFKIILKCDKPVKFAFKVAKERGTYKHYIPSTSFANTGRFCGHSSRSYWSQYACEENGTKYTVMKKEKDNGSVRWYGFRKHPIEKV